MKSFKKCYYNCKLKKTKKQQKKHHEVVEKRKKVLYNIRWNNYVKDIILQIVTKM